MKQFGRFAYISILFAILPTLAIAQDSSASNPKNDTSDKYWNGGFNKSNLEFVLGYVNKSWICTYESGTQREDFFGDTDDKYLHGTQFGLLYTPSFSRGLGLRTGLFVELYTSKKNWITEWCNRFSECDLYIPVHASYRIPFSENIGLHLFAGMGFQRALSGRYENLIEKRIFKKDRPTTAVQVLAEQEYGNGWPQKNNWQAECGLNFSYKVIGFNFCYSFGIVDHGIQKSFDGGESYVTARRSRQDKILATVLLYIF